MRHYTDRMRNSPELTLSSNKVLRLRNNNKENVTGSIEQK